MISTKKTLLILTVLSNLLFCFGQKKQEVDFVNTLVGTPIKGHGGVPLTVTPPFAMTHFSPQTCENRLSRMYYVYDDPAILGFMATHQPTVWMGDYGYLSVMPEIDSLKLKPADRKLLFSHADEVAKPYYYAVKMKADQNKVIKAELAGTERCGIFRFTFPKSKNAHLVFQSINVDEVIEGYPARYKNDKRVVNSVESRSTKLTAFIKFDKDKKQIIGYNPDRTSFDIGPELKNFKGYFVIQFDKTFDSFGTWNNDKIFPETAALSAKKRLGAYVSFSTKQNEVVTVKIATSFISVEQAQENLSKEIPNWDLDQIASQTKKIWQSNLEKIKLEGVTEDQKKIFYTSFYRTLLFPREFSEYGKYYSAFDDAIHEGVSYSDYSLWDTFRALHPFLIFVQPDRVNDMITSMLNMYQEGGRLPMWPNPAETNIMIGTHADAVISDAYVKGLRNYDTKLAYEAMRKDAMIATDCDSEKNRQLDRQKWQCYEGQAGLQFFHTLGYVPSDYKSESVARTIEYGIDDFGIAQVAKDMQKKDDYDKLMQWSKNYKNLYNSKTGFFSPRLYNGKWEGDTVNGFTEGSPWTYLFGAMQDIPGTIALMGGNEAFAKKLDQNFAENHYVHSNEPGHHYIFLYDYCEQPWKAQELVRKHFVDNYKTATDGLNGSDDLGQMSAWYIFGAMGFYPVTPATGMYAIGAPQYPKLTMSYSANGTARKLEIIANNISEKNKYIQKVTLDGTILEKPFISHEAIINGKKLIFEMGEKPNYDWK